MPLLTRTAARFAVQVDTRQLKAQPTELHGRKPSLPLHEPEEQAHAQSRCSISLRQSCQQKSDGRSLQWRQMRRQLLMRLQRA